MVTRRMVELDPLWIWFWFYHFGFYRVNVEACLKIFSFGPDLAAQTIETLTSF